jgi:hypothetical protein
MNLFEGLMAAVLFVVVVLLTAYIGHLAVDLARLKYVFEATRHADCGTAHNASGPIVVSSCVWFYFNGSFVVKIHNITTGYPYAS